MILQDPNKTHGALSAPEYPASLPKNSKWLGGEGYGVWFALTKPENLDQDEYRIRRFSHLGILDCDRIYRLKNEHKFNINEEYEFAYISHCQKTTVAQNGKAFVFEYIGNYEA